MASPTNLRRPAASSIIANLFRLRRNRSLNDVDGSSRRGRRVDDSSTHSAVFDLELSQRGGDRSSRGRRTEAAPPTPHPSTNPTVQRARYLGAPVARFEVDLLQDVAALREGCCTPDGQVDLSQLVGDLTRMGYACRLQINDPTDPEQRPGPATGADRTCLEKLRHSFIVCMGRTDGSLQHYCLVDPRFRDQFQVAQPTPEYASLLQALGAEFVGSAVRLQALAALLCSEIVAAYEQQGLEVPPWRKPTVMLSRWFDVGPVAPHRPPPLPGRQADPPVSSLAFFQLLDVHQRSLQPQRQRKHAVGAAPCTQVYCAAGEHAATAACEPSNKPHRQHGTQAAADMVASPGRPVDGAVDGAPQSAHARMELPSIQEGFRPAPSGRINNSNSSSATGGPGSSDSHAAGHSALVHARPSHAKSVSLLARGLRSMSQKPPWSSLLPGVQTVRRMGVAAASRDDGSSRRGKQVA